MVALLLFAPGTSKAVAEEGGLIARAQAGEVGSQLDVEFPQVLFGLLDADATSYLNAEKEWRPSLPSRQARHFTMADLLRYAGAA